jgi:hypothetical protein
MGEWIACQMDKQKAYKSNIINNNIIDNMFNGWCWTGWQTPCCVWQQKL